MIIKNARLLPELTEGYAQEYGDVKVIGNRIEGIYPAASLSAEEGEQVLDACGKTLLPGMMDLHMHLYFHSSNLEAMGKEGPAEALLHCIEYAKEMLKWGFTTVRDCGSTFNLGVITRDAIADGVLQGPRVFACGKCITPTAKGNDTFPNLYTEVDRPDEMMGIVRKEHVLGTDFVKYMGTGSVANRTGAPGELVTTYEELAALQKAAESVGTYVAVHCHGTEGIKMCAEIGIHTIEHASVMTQECIDLILAHKNRTCLVPTLNPVYEIYESAAGAVPRWLYDKIVLLIEHTAMLVEAERQGCLLGWGTDTSLETFRKIPNYEFYARSKCGFTPMEILKQATINGARILGVEEELGSIRAGKLADLILVDGNPDQDILLMRQLPLMVMKDGKIERFD